MAPVSVLFVCLGNICRSTMAEGVFQSVSRKEPFTDLVKNIDSCGTSAWHVGSPPDERTMATLQENGITDYKHAARQISADDFDDFDYVFAMDRSNLSDLQTLQKQKRPDSKAKVMLWGAYSGSGSNEVVKDPYYGGQDGFEVAYEQCVRFSANFLREVKGDPEAVPEQ